MSSPILPIRNPSSGPSTSLVPLAPVSARDRATFRSELDASERALAVEPPTDAPPAEVLEEIAAAGRTSEQLRAAGHQVRFLRDEQSGRIAIELQGREGDMLRTLSIAETLDLATGKPQS